MPAFPKRIRITLAPPARAGVVSEVEMMKAKLPNPQVFFDGIDYGRLNTFKPVKQVIEALNLPRLRQRKLSGIRNAHTTQIEDGGDSPGVNKLLVEALRAAVIFQVGEDTARPFIEALARFEQAERLR